MDFPVPGPLNDVAILPCCIAAFPHVSAHRVSSTIFEVSQRDFSQRLGIAAGPSDEERVAVTHWLLP
eukprot:6468685-Lingulodinium_polyedra.AAC.1